jgi:hypothetical protein
MRPFKPRHGILAKLKPQRCTKGTPTESRAFEGVYQGRAWNLTLLIDVPSGFFVSVLPIVFSVVHPAEAAKNAQRHRQLSVTAMNPSNTQI